MEGPSTGQWQARIVAIVRDRACCLIALELFFVVRVESEGLAAFLVLRRTLHPARDLEQFRHSLERRWAKQTGRWS